MSGHSVEEMQKHVRVYLYVFAALAVLTVITVAVSYVHLGHGGNIIAALIIAGVKGSLVACYFMHMLSERKMLFGILILTVFFFLLLMLLPLGEHADQMGVPVPSEAAPAGGHDVH